MSDEFDAYKDLLSIESAERPPNHYVLLGLEPFESDRAAIDEAAGERMSLLQEFANSEHLDASQKLLNEVSAARRCLLNETKKIAYDEDLRAKQKRAASRGAASGKSGKGGKQAPMLPVGIAAGVAVILLILFFVFRGGPAPTGNLVVDWPLDEREGASAEVDGKALEITDENPLHFQIPDGRRRLVFRREGYENIPKTHSFSNIRVKMNLRWKPKKQ